MKYIKQFDEAREFTFTNIVKLCLLNKKLIALSLVIVVVLSFLFTYVVPSRYSADASIMPMESSSSSGGLSSFLQSMGGGISLGSLPTDNKSQILTEYLQSREIAKFIYDSLVLKNNKFFKDELLPDAYEKITKSIASKANRSGLVLLSVEMSTGFFPSSSDKALAAKMSADIANVAIAGLDYITRNKTVSKARNKRIYIEKVLAEKKEKLDSIDSRLQNFQRENKVLAIDEQAKAIIESSANLGTELLKAEHELTIKRMDFQPNSREIQMLEESIDKLRSQYLKIQNGGILGSSDYSIPLSKVPDLVKEYTSIIRDKKIMEQVNAYLESQKYQESIQETSDTPVIEPLDRAIVPIRRSSPSKLIAIVLGAFLSLTISISAIVVKNVHNKKFILK